MRVPRRPPRDSPQALAFSLEVIGPGSTAPNPQLMSHGELTAFVPALYTPSLPSLLNPAISR